MKNLTKNIDPNWETGDLVRVGFLTLKVLKVTRETESKPDEYTLITPDGKKEFEFNPFNGLRRIY